MRREPHEVLGVARQASVAEARASYLSLVEIFHPDRMQGLRPEVQAQAADRLRELNEAWAAIERRGVVTTSETPPTRPPGHRPGAPEGVRGRAVPGLADRVGERTEPVFYDVELRSIDANPPLRLRWKGEAGGVIMGAVRDRFREGRAGVRQIDWGAFEAVLSGQEAEALLAEVLERGIHEVQVAKLPPPPPASPSRTRGIRSRRHHRVPAPGVEVEAAPRPSPPLGPAALGEAIGYLDGSGRYRIRAEDY